METIKLKINGIEVTAPKGSTILEAARLAHIEIPTLCFLKEINEIGACRVCIVELKNGKLVTSGRRNGSIYQYSKGHGFQKKDHPAFIIQP